MTKDDFIFNLKRCGCLYKDGNTYYEENELIECFEDVGAFNQSSVRPQEPKTGHWKRISIDKYSEHAKYWYRCDRCGKDNLGNTDWCPNCGCRMVEPQESEDKE